MPNSNLLVPGTAGITFVDNAGADVGYPVRMRLGTATDGLLGKSAEELEELLSMAHLPGPIAPHRTYWRTDMRHSARQLLDFLRDRKPAGGRWSVVGHSQGALLTVLASKMASEEKDPPDPASRERFSDLVASVTMVGAPLSGTVNAARALIVGDGAGDAAAPVFRRIPRTWPALFQMAPAWRCIQDENGADSPEEHQLSCVTGWSYMDVSDDMIERARVARLLLRDPLSHLRGDVRVAILYARNRNTGLKLERRSGRLNGDPVVRQKGDSLVPFQQTLAWVGDHIRPFVTVFEPPVNDHAFLLDDPVVVRRVRQLLR